ncbi:S9 family peptidase [Lichenicoccus sp.]|uniref:S9 family peptidase n=1 Tax=Lichenicoccus sp. TaxID=2781899 RepID=UPI003D14EA04
MNQTQTRAPVAERRPIRIEQLGRIRTDDYAWMKDENWQRVLRDPSVLREDIALHLRAENAYEASLLAPTEALQATLLAEMKGRLKPDEMSPPLPDGAWDYYARYAGGAEQPVYARRPRGGGDEQVLLDVDALAKPHDYFVVADAQHSPDHRLFAYAEDAQGSEVYRIRVLDLQSGKLLDDSPGNTGPVESSTGDFTFSPCSAYLLWTFRDDNGRPTRIFRRPARGGPDELVYEEHDPGFFIGVGTTASRAWITIECGDQETTETWLIPAGDPTAAPRLVAARDKGVRYSLSHWRDRFIIRTNLDGATDFKLMQASDAAPAREHWQDFVPHRPGHYIVRASAFRDHLVYVERHEANNSIVIMRHPDDKDGGDTHSIAIDEPAYLLSFDGGYEYETALLRTGYQSPTTPRQWFEYDMDTRERRLLKTQEIPSGHDPAHYRTRRLQAQAPDGALVPITVLMRHDSPTDGTAPLLLYGYGAYGHAIEPGFSITTLNLVDRGWVYAIAHVRGGSEKGWGWFLDGRGAQKPNSFTDFIACAEHLVEHGLADPTRIVAQGGSAGGLLMGAVANLRPELFAGIIAQVPFVDMLNTMSDLSLPLTPPEWPEWGNPITDPEAYDLIAGYSPYDNIRPVAYPAILALGGLSDPRVTYWEPAKWAAKLRAVTTGDRPILLRTNMEAGHGGASGRYERLKETALVQAFALWCTRGA